jgi:hypothetical protein
MRRFRHYKRGTVYEIVTEAVWEPTETAVFVYRDVDSGKVWVRPQSDFFEMVEFEGRDVPRFSEVLAG